jgi:hypothetical protein
MIGGSWMAVDDDSARSMADEGLQRANAILDRIERSGVNARDPSAADFLLREAEDILGQLGDLKAAEQRVDHPRPSAAPPPEPPRPNNAMLEALRELVKPSPASDDDADVPRVTVRRRGSGFEVKGYGHRRVFSTYEAADAAGLILALTNVSRA